MERSEEVTYQLAGEKGELRTTSRPNGLDALVDRERCSVGIRHGSADVLAAHLHGSVGVATRGGRIAARAAELLDFARIEASGSLRCRMHEFGRQAEKRRPKRLNDL